MWVCLHLKPTAFRRWVVHKESDNIHYSREFRALDTSTGKRRLRKVLFGFGTEEMYKKIDNLIREDFTNTDINNYEDFKKIALDQLE